MYALQTNNLTKVYGNGTQALRGVDLRIEEGDFFALLGANGAGKTTIIGIMTGLVVKTGGAVQIFDADIDQDHNRAKRMIGVVPQEFNFSIFETVSDIILQQAGYYGIPLKEAKTRLEQLLHDLSLSEKRHTPGRMLSGGMKRRLMIARALIHKPRFLLLDEPTAGVDVELRRSMWDYLRELNRAGTTILLTTHYLEEVQQMCRNAAMIKEGKIILQDSVRNLERSMESQTYVVEVDIIRELAGLQEYTPVTVDDTTLEIKMKRDQDINTCIALFTEAAMSVRSFRLKENQLEELFLSLLANNEE